jgi:DNA polymerase-3 subunit theta
MSKWNIASFSKDEQDKVSVDKAAAAVAWQERMNKPVVHELVEREQPEHLREYIREIACSQAEQPAAAARKCT